MRLIDADKLTIDCYAQGQDGTVPAVTTEQIDEAPTIEERKHGHWIWDNDEEVWKCSNCKSGDDFLKNKFCKDCGAIMDESEVGENEIN